MEGSMSFRRLVRKTCIKIVLQFLSSVALLYLLPLLTVSGESPTKSGAPGVVFFNVFSWMYLCGMLILIVSVNIRKLLRILKAEMDTVYRRSMGIEPQGSGEELTLREFSETHRRIREMQAKILAMIAAEKEQKEDLMFKVSAASHDLKTPLTVIQGNAELLLYSDPSEEQRRNLEDIATASRRIGDYLNELIRYSKTFYDDRSEWREVAVADVAEAVEQEAFYLFEDKSRLQVTDRTGDGRAQVFLHWNDLLRAISNLVKNALEYGDPEAQIELTMAREGEQLAFSVRNRGSRFSEELMKNCDKLFYRQDKGRNADGEHYGIGLAFVKRVAVLHSGALDVENRDSGVEVTLRLKVGRKDEHREAKSEGKSGELK